MSGTSIVVPRGLRDRQSDRGGHPVGRRRGRLLSRGAGGRTRDIDAGGDRLRRRCITASLDLMQERAMVCIGEGLNVARRIP